MTIRRVTELAEERYAKTAARAFDKIMKIQEAAQDFPAPEGESKITWGHVESMARLNEELGEILEWIESRE